MYRRPEPRDAAWPAVTGHPGSVPLFANALDVHVDLRHGYVDRPLHFELHRLLEVVRDLRYADAVLDDDEDLDAEPIFHLDHLDAAIDVPSVQQLGHAVPQPTRGHSGNAVAAQRRVGGDGGDGGGKDLDPAPLAGLDEGGGGLRGHGKPMVQSPSAHPRNHAGICLLYTSPSPRD